MINYESYKLDEEDIKVGIEDFFTQLLIEAKKMKKDAKNLEDLASDKPTIIYLTGQPGSGKTTLGKYLQMQLAQQGKCAVEVGSDKIATYHKYYNELLKLLPNECYSLSREFVKPAKPVIFNKLIANKLNILRECSLTKGEKDYNGMQKFIDSGYEVDINIMAVDKYESFLACTERDIKLMELGFDPRPVARANHDRMYSPLLQELIEIQKRGLSTRISVFTRGGNSSIHPRLAWSTGDNKYQNAHEAIISERAKERKILFQKPQEYLQRISDAKQSISLMITEKRLRNNYLEGLDQLEAEFVNELAFERNA